MEIGHEACILCESRARELIMEKDGWRVYRCLECGLGFTDPQPSPEELEQYYGKNYFSEHYDQGLDPRSAAFEKRLKGEGHRVRFVRKLKRSGHLLDLGCGYGYFLYACRRKGFHVMGLDISEWAGQYAKGQLGIDVETGEIGEAKLPAHTFDVVTMWHSLEHASNPKIALEKALLWLKTGGIVVVDVPNYEGTDAKYKGKDWDGWSLPYHFWHFTRGSLEKMLCAHGLEVIKTKTYHSEAIKEKLAPFRLSQPLARLVAKMYSGSSIAVIARRKAGL